MNLLNENAWRQQVQAGLGDLARNTRLLEWSRSASIAYVRRAYNGGRTRGLIQAVRSASDAARRVGGVTRVVVSEQLHLTNASEIRTTTLYDEDRNDPWAVKIIAEGGIIMALYLQSPGVLHNVAEVVLDRLGERSSYVVSMDDALVWAQQRQERLELESKRVEGQIEAVYREPDGSYTLWLLQDRQSYIREGLVMHHCTGDYDVTPGRRLYSVRDATGKSHATVEWKAATKWMFGNDPERISQALGFANQPMAPDVAAFVERWRATIGLPTPAKIETQYVGYAVGGDSISDGSQPQPEWQGIAGINVGHSVQLGRDVIQLTPDQVARLLEQPDQISAGYRKPDPCDLFSLVSFAKEERAPTKMILLKPRPTGNTELHYDTNTSIFQDREAEEENGGAASAGCGVGADARTPQCSAGARCDGQGCADNATDEQPTPSLGLGAIRGH